MGVIYIQGLQMRRITFGEGNSHIFLVCLGFLGGGGWSDLVLSAALRPAKSQCCPTQRLIPKTKGETTLKATLEDLGLNNITLLTCPVNR